MTTLTQDQRQTLTDEMSAELNKGRIGFNFTTVTGAQMPNVIAPPVSAVFVALQKAAFIPDLTEIKFSDCIDDVNFTVNFVKAETKIRIKQLVAAKSTSATSKSVTQN